MYATQSQFIMPPHVNSDHRLFGGQLMAWIDVVGAIAARRHCLRNVTTATVDCLHFLHPVELGDLLRLEARLTWTGRSSMEVQVNSYVESLRCGGKDMLVNQAYVVYVAVDESGRPTAVTPFEPQTPEQKDLWAQAQKRREYRLAQRCGSGA